MGQLSRLAEGASARANRIVGGYLSGELPIYYVMEFPRSGGTWLGDMIADYLQLPFPKNSLLPIACKSVIHGHWRYSPKLRNVFYIHRDGRDVVTSSYFKEVKYYRENPSLRHRLERERPALREMATRDYLDDQLFGEYVRQWTELPVNWAGHIAEWRDKPHVATTSYESLVADTEGELRRLLGMHLVDPVDEWRLSTAVEKYSFYRQTGRRPGNEDLASNKRKGVVGDWRNHFDRRSAEFFRDKFGDLLIELGYESSNAWTADIQEQAGKRSLS